MTAPASKYTDRAAGALRAARHEVRASLRQVAARAGTSHATLLAYEEGRKVPSVATFLRLLDACGFAVDFHRSRRIRHRDGVERGKELEAVLDLAAQFPARHARKLAFPRFPNG
jgi:transcriptional regulator with XRE-family HTH domain